MTDARKPVDRVERLEEELALVRAAQKTYAEFTQEQVDRIFFAAAMAAGKMRLPLAKMAVEETGMGVVEDKVIKNHFASEYIYNAYRDAKTCGVIEEDKAYGITPPGRASGRDRGRDSHHQPHLHGHFQDAGLPENPQRHHHQPPPARQEVHGRGRAHRAGGRGGGRRAGAHHLLDRRAQPGDDQPHHVRVRHASLATGGPGMVQARPTPAASPRWAWARATCPPSSTRARTFCSRSTPSSTPRPLTTA